MNREEVIEGLVNALNGLGTAWKADEAISAAIILLAADANAARKDPTTGLFPCGCGGAAHFWGSSGDESFYLVECEKCEIETIYYSTKKKAREAWNAAMGDIDL